MMNLEPGAAVTLLGVPAMGGWPAEPARPAYVLGRLEKGFVCIRTLPDREVLYVHEDRLAA